MSNNVTQELQTTAFGELSVAQKDPEIQVSSQYDNLTQVRTIVVSGGTAGASGGQFVAETGTNAAGFSAIFTDRQILSRPGQGSETILTAKFTEGVANSRQIAGVATALDGLLFGYKDAEFGVFFQHRGSLIIEELTITTPASGSESTTITINGDDFTVPITAGTTSENATEIAVSLTAQVPLYRFTQNQNQVVARALLDAPKTGSFAFSSPGAAVASWVQIADGKVREEEFIKQDDWSEQATFEQPVNPQMLNRYKIVFNGSVDYYIEDGITGLYTLVHRRVHTNVETTPMFSVAAFRIVWGAQNEGNTTNLLVSGTEGAAFNQGERQLIKPTRAAFNLATSVTTTATNILTIRCREVFGTKVNLGRLIPLAISAFTDGNKGAIIEVCKDMTFDTAEPNFSYIDKDNSITEIDTTFSTVSGGVCLLTLVIGTSVAAQSEAFRDLLLPGETLTIAMRVPSAAAADMNVSVVWEEDL